MEKILSFGGRTKEPDIRMLYDMSDVIYDQEWLKGAENLELYYMYRDLSLSKKDAQIIKENNLRYDITIIPPRMLGQEFVKTAGHYHPFIQPNLTYTEIYEVLEGEAFYLLQKLDDKNNDRVLDVVVIKATQGDKVIIPPLYGHITINSSNKTLKMANWVARDFSSVYDPIKEKKGGAYFLVKGGLIRNENYTEVPTPRVLEPTNFSEVGLSKNKEIYALIREPEKLEYLTNPHKYEWLFEKILEKE
ncbi:MAG: glucose-6-phosphate isomerase family protein [Methanosarcinales archaeon]